MTVSGFVLDGMTRGTGWRFLSMGRRLERLTQLCAALETPIGERPLTAASTGCSSFADSTMTYRARYTVAPEWLPVLDLLVRDEANPRSVAFQLKGLSEFVDKLEREHGAFAGFGLGAARHSLAGLDARDLRPESPTLRNLLRQLQSRRPRAVRRADAEVLLAHGVAQRAVGGVVSLPRR